MLRTARLEAREAEEFQVHLDGERLEADQFLSSDDPIFLIVQGWIDIVILKEQQGWQVFKTLPAGAALPIISLHKLSRRYNTAVKIRISQGAHLLEFSK